MSETGWYCTDLLVSEVKLKAFSPVSMLIIALIKDLSYIHLNNDTGKTSVPILLKPRAALDSVNHISAQMG